MGTKKKRKINESNASGSGSIVSKYLEQKDKLYERDAKGQKIASETREKAKTYYGESKRYSDSEYQNQSESRYRRLAEQAVEIQKKNDANSQKYKRASALINSATKAEDSMRSEIAKRTAREKSRKAAKEAEQKEAERRSRDQKNNWFTTSDGNARYKNPSLMGYEELQKTLSHVTKNKDLFKKKLADSGLFKSGFAGEWEKVDPSEFKEKLGSKGVSWEDYKEYRSIWSKYQQNLEYMRELESQKPRVELEHEYDSLSGADKKLVSDAVDYEAGLEIKGTKSFGVSLADMRDQPITDASRRGEVYEKYPRLAELKEKGIDVDYIMESERTKRSNTRQEVINSINADFADKHPILGSVASVGSNLAAPMELAEDINHAIKNAASDKSYDIDYGMHPFSQYTNTTRGTVSEGIDNSVGKFVYNAGMSTADSAAAILATKGLGKGSKLASGAASTLMGANAANQSYMDTYERTGNAGQSLLTGLSAGLAEWASERFSLESFNALKTSIPKSFRSYAKNLVKQGVVEGSEEFASDIANAFADRAINGSKSEYNTSVKEYIQQGYTKEEAKEQATKDFFRQVGEDMLTGAFSGGLFGTYANINSSVQYKNAVKKNGVSISENNEGNELVYYARKNGISTYEDAKDDTERQGKIAVDIMENAANRIDSARGSGELAAVYREVTQDIPDSLGVEVDQMVRTKARSLAEDFNILRDKNNVTERRDLYEIMENSLYNAMNRTAAVNEKRQQGGQGVSMENPEETMNEEDDLEPGREDSVRSMSRNGFSETSEYEETVPEGEMENEVQNTPMAENVTTSNFKRSRNAAFTASDQTVSVKGFREIGTEDATVETSDGEVVSLSDLSFEDQGTQNMFNIASKMENAAAATALVDNYNGRDNAGVYANNFRMAYRMGRLGSVSFDKMMQSSKEFRVLANKTPMRLAYEMGKAHAENEKATQKERSVAPAHSDRNGTGEYRDSRTVAEDQNSFGKVKEALATKTGLDILDLDTLTDDETATVNGLLDMEKGQMAFADDAENKFGVMIHESLEFASVMSEGEYQKLMGVVLNYMVDKHGVEDIHSLIESYQKAYESVEGKKAYEEAAEEMLNDAVSGVFYDAEGAKSFVDWVMKDESLDIKGKRNVFQKMADLVKHILDKIKEYIDDTPMTKAARMAAELKVEQKEEIRQLFMDAVDQAGEQYKYDINAKDDNAVTDRETTERDIISKENVKYSIKVGLEEQIDHVMNGTVPDNYTHVYLGETTKALKELGWGGLPMLITNQHVYSIIKTEAEAKEEGQYNKRRNYHGLGKELFIKAKKHIDSPVMIIKSNQDIQNADVVLVTSLRDQNGNVVIAAVKPEGIGRIKGNLTSANVVLSMYGKDSIQNYVKTAYQENRILKINPNEAVMPLVQFQGDLPHQDYSDNLTQYKKIVKNIISKKDIKHSLSVSENADNLRRSLTDTMSTQASLIEENEHLRQVIKELESEFKPGVKTVPEPAMVEKVCRKLLKKYNSTFDLETFKDNVTKLYAYMNEENADYEAALKITSEIARGVLEKSTQKDTTMYDTYKDLRDYFRKTKLSLSEAQKNEVKYMYGSMGEFRKSNFGRMRISDEGTSLDQVWGELSERYPELLKADTSDGDMITEVLNVLDALQPVYRNVSGEDMEQASYDLALQIYSEMSKVPQKKTFKDKADEAAEYEWKESNRVYLNLINDFRKECKKQFEEGMKESLDEHNADKKKRIREAYGKIRDYVNVIEVTQNGELIRKYQHEIQKQKRYIERLKKGQDRKIAELKMEQRQYRKKLSEQRKQTEEKNKIRRLHARMRQMLLKPTESMYVPKDLVNAVIEVCETVNLGAKEGTELYKVLDRAKNVFEKMQKDPVYSGDFDPVVASYIEYIKERTDGKDIYQLSSRDLADIYDAMKQVYELIRRSTKLIRKDKYQDVKKEGESVIKELKEAKGLSEWAAEHRIGRAYNATVNKLLNPYRFFRRISGYQDGALMRAWEDLNDGQRKMLKIQQEAEAITSGTFKTKEIQKLMKTMDKKNGLVDSGLRYDDGKKVEITKGMRMALVMHGMNKDNLKHMRYGGIIMPNIKLYVNGDIKGAYEKKNTKRVTGITKAKLDAMEMAMSAEEKQMLASFKKLFHEYTGKVINDTSMELYGYKKATQENYYPIKVDKDYVKTNPELLMVDKSIEGAGFLRSRIDSKIPLVLESIVETSENTIKQVSHFGGLAIPLRNFNKLINMTNYEMTMPEDALSQEDDLAFAPKESVKEWLKLTWGNSANTYLENMIADLQEARLQPPDILDKLCSNYAFGVLAGNVSTIIKQISAYPTVAATVGWKNATKAMLRGGKRNLPISRADMELIDKYTPILWDRNRGNGTKELADIKEMSSIAQLPGLRQIKDAIQAVDVAMVGRFWYAAQYYVDDNYKELEKGTDRYYEKVAEVFNKSVEETQSMNTVMQSTDFLRSPKQGRKLIIMFMSQNLQNFGIMYDSFMNLKAKMKTKDKGKIKIARKEFARAWSSQIVSAMMFSALAIVAKGVLHKMWSYQDDEGEITAASLFSQWGQDFLSAMLGSVPLAEQIYDGVMAVLTGDDFYGIEVAILESMKNVVTYGVKTSSAITQIWSDDEEEQKKGRENIDKSILSLAGEIGNLSGVPIGNATNVGKAIYGHWKDITSGDGFLSFSADKEEAKSSVYGEKIYDALLEGDKGTAGEYRSKMKESGTKGEGDVETAVVNQLVKRNDLVRQAAEYRLKNNTDGYMKIYTKLKGMGFKHYEVVTSINSVMEKLKGDDSSGPKGAHDYVTMYKADDLVRAIEAEKGYEDILKQMYEEKIKAGKDDKKAKAAIRASVTKVYKAKYKEYRTAHEKQKILKKMYLLKIDGKCLYDNGILEKWNKDK